MAGSTSAATGDDLGCAGAWLYSGCLWGDKIITAVMSGGGRAFLAAFLQARPRVEASLESGGLVVYCKMEVARGAGAGNCVCCPTL